MSHNTNKINAQEPSIDGGVSQSLNDLSDVIITSAADGEFLQYEAASTAWKNVGAPSSSVAHMRIGIGESDAYSASPASGLGVNDILYIYDDASALQNTITGASVTSTASTTPGGKDWIEKITLPTGNYMVYAGYGVEFSASGYLNYQLVQDTGSGWSVLAYNAVVGENVTAYDFASGQILTYVQLSGSTDLALRVQATSNVDSVANQGNVPANRGFMIILKV